MSTVDQTRAQFAQVRRPNPVAVGTIVWLGSEVMFFAGLFAIFFTLRGLAPEQFANGAAHLDLLMSSINTTVLVASSFTAQMGVFAAERHQAWRQGARLGAVEWFFITFFMGAFFVSGQVMEYSTLFSEGITLSTNSFGSAFFLTTGFHGLHVTAGLFAFLFAIGRIFAVKRMGHKEVTTCLVVSYYWHFVDVVWVGLFFVIYILPLIS